MYNAYKLNTYTYDVTGVHTANQDGEMINTLSNRMDYDAFGNQYIGESPDPFGYCGYHISK